MDKKTRFEDSIAILFGSALFSASMALFLTPCGIILGGASGAAMTLHQLVSLPIGSGMFLLNLPLLLISIRMTGWQGMTRTVVGILSTAIATDAFAFLPPATDDPLLAAVFGGALMGAGGAIMIPRGYTTGGSELAAYLLHQRFRQIQMGTAILCLDALIVIGSSLLLRHVAGIIYSVTAIAAYSITLDTVMSGLGRAKLSIIISDHHETICSAITEKIDRGATLLPCQGWYTKTNRTVILCVVKRTEIFSLKTLVLSIDPSAFFIIANAAQVLGHGFHRDE